MSAKTSAHRPHHAAAVPHKTRAATSAVKKPTTRKSAATVKPAAVREAAMKALLKRDTAQRTPRAAVPGQDSPDFAHVMKTLEGVRSRSDELDQRISRLAARLA